MDPTSIYATAAGGICLAVFFVRISPHMTPLVKFLLHWIDIVLGCLISSASLFLAKHLTYAVFLPRHKLFGPCTRSVAIMHLAYAGVNLHCALLPARSLAETAQRAGRLSLINLIIAMGSGCCDLCADVFGIPRHVCQQVHRATSWMTISLFTAHAVAASLASSGPLRVEISGLTGIGIGMILIVMAYLRHAAYESFLRAHQMLAFVLLYAIRRHLPSATARTSSQYVLVAFLVPILSLLYNISLAVYRNGVFSSRGRTCMTLSFRGGVEQQVAANMHIALPRLISVDPGQYVNLWMPSVSFWSWIQVHPYMVVSWNQSPTDEIDVIVQARHGFSARLVRHALMASPKSVSFPGLVIGPHGTSKDVNRCTSILAVTSDSGICSVISYVKRSICSPSESRTKRVHLVWQVEQPGLVPSVELVLTELLELDAANKHILHLSIYFDRGSSMQPIHQQVVVCLGKADYQSIVQDEVLRNGSYELCGEGKEKRLKPQMAYGNDWNMGSGDLLIMVAASDEIRDQVQLIARNHVHQRVRMMCLAYQP